MNDVLDTVARTLASEFSDLADAAQITRVVLRLTIAALLGGLLGWERENHGKAAGLRTHMLVAMGSALFILVAQQAGIDTANASRLIQGVISGIGFLGAGAILKNAGKDAEEPRIHGLTTAASIWLTAAIGVAAGLGEESTAILSAVLAWLILGAIPWLTRTKTDKAQAEKT